MEYGTSFPESVVYMADANADNPEEAERFIRRAHIWLEANSLILGEGYIQFQQLKDGKTVYKLTAPRISGPVGISKLDNN